MEFMLYLTLQVILEIEFSFEKKNQLPFHLENKVRILFQIFWKANFFVFSGNDHRGRKIVVNCMATGYCLWLKHM